MSAPIFYLRSKGKRRKEQRDKSKTEDALVYCCLFIYSVAAASLCLLNWNLFPTRIVSLFPSLDCCQKSSLEKLPDPTYGKKVSSNQNGCSRAWARDPAFSRSSVLSGVGTP